MSCSEIQVTILGDIADVQELLAEVKADKATAVQAAVDAVNAASEAQRSASEAAQAPVNIKTMDEGRQLGAVASAYNFVGEGVKVEKLPNDTFNIEIPGAADSALTPKDIKGLDAALSQLRNNKIDGVTSKVDDSKRTVAFTFTSGGNTVATDTIDLSPLFGKALADAKDIFYGFSTVNTLTASIVKTGSLDHLKSINGYNVDLSRSHPVLSYMFVWVPDLFGAITGFKFSGTFVDQWQSAPLTVDGVPGKVYVSDNQTLATSVSFEVEQ